MLTHGAPAWHPTTADNTLKLERIQRKAIRFAYGKDCTPTEHIASLSSYFSYMDVANFYKGRNNISNLPCVLSIKEGRAIRGENGATRLLLPKVRTSMLQSGFVYRSTSLWNSLPSDVKTSHGPIFFRKLRASVLT